MTSTMRKTTTTPSGSCDGVLMLILTASVLSLFTAVIFTALLDANRGAADTRGVAYVRTSETLPAKCEQFYNNGTDQWIECMGVGKK